jgi:hypothetical protein
MRLDIDSYIARGRELKKAGGSGLQVSEMLEREGLKPEVRQFILAQITKAELKERAEAVPAGRAFMTAFLGWVLVGGGAIIAYKLFMGVNGWSIISTAPFLMMAGGVKLLMTK